MTLTCFPIQLILLIHVLPHICPVVFLVCKKDIDCHYEILLSILDCFVCTEYSSIAKLSNEETSKVLLVHNFDCNKMANT